MQRVVVKALISTNVRRPMVNTLHRKNAYFDRVFLKAINERGMREVRVRNYTSTCVPENCISWYILYRPFLLSSSS